MCNQFNGLAHFPLFISIKMFKLPKLFLRNVNTYAIKIDNLLSYLKKKKEEEEIMPHCTFLFEKKNQQHWFIQEEMF